METLGERLRRLRLARGMKPRELAEAMGVTRAAVVLVESGRSNSFSAANALKAAQALGVTPEELQFGEDGMFHPGQFPPGGGSSSEPAKVAQSTPVPYRSRTPTARNVSIIGFAIANPDEDGFYEYEESETTAAGHVLFATKDPDAYALEVKGDSMQPRIRPRELIVVEPNTPVTPGDDVVVKTRTGRTMVKQLLMQRRGEVTLGSINQAHRQTTISLEDIEHMHAVVDIVSAKRREGGEG